MNVTTFGVNVITYPTWEWICFKYNSPIGEYNVYIGSEFPNSYDLLILFNDFAIDFNSRTRKLIIR